MKKSKLVATFVAVLLIVSLCALCLYGCNDEGVGIEGKGVSRPEDIFTNDLDTTDSENLIANAHVTASSADITSSASYKILSADATFDSVKEDYKTPVRKNKCKAKLSIRKAEVLLLRLFDILFC